MRGRVQKCQGDPVERPIRLKIAERWLGLAERIAVDLVVLVLLLRTLASSLDGGPGTEQAFAAGMLTTLVLVQSGRR